ncbi:MAG TPA: sensor histidine kinase [Gemmatimonadaceae bacterium]|jgi:signal transduction histidine kinase|nr:sensor histidine kinase [Gemmatimonadaceae bacterium]
MRLAALRVPLVAKLVGANLVVVAVLTAAWVASGAVMNAEVLLAIVAVLVLHLVVIGIALRPIQDLEAVASRVWKGDFAARVEQSAVADDQVLRVGAMFNLLLDGLATDRARMRALAAEVIEVGDRERAALARELHDSTAQRLAALMLQISAAARDANDPALAARLGEIRDAAEEVTEEVRLLSHTVHPRVLDDLGLVPALRKLARDSSTGTGIDVDVEANTEGTDIPHPVAAALYRVAQEAVRNAVRHAAPHRVRVVFHELNGTATLEILDDGKGFNLQEAERRRPGMGLLSMRERVSLVDGELSIKTAPGDGTAISATVPTAAHEVW